MMSNYIIVDGELYHHGVKGMKWGVRRYQNRDGSLTPKGKKHYDNLTGTEMHRKLQRAYNRTKGGWLGKNYGKNVTRVLKEQDERETKLKKRLSSENKEYIALDNELKKLNKQYDDNYQKFLTAENNGNYKKADALSIEGGRIEKEFSRIARKQEAIYNRELQKMGKSMESDYADRSVAALMDMGFDRSTSESFTKKMLKEDRYNRAVYIDGF